MLIFCMHTVEISSVQCSWLFIRWLSTIVNFEKDKFSLNWKIKNLFNLFYRIRISNTGLWNTHFNNRLPFEHCYTGRRQWHLSMTETNSSSECHPLRHVEQSFYSIVAFDTTFNLVSAPTKFRKNPSKIPKLLWNHDISSALNAIHPSEPKSSLKNHVFFNFYSIHRIYNTDQT